MAHTVKRRPADEPLHTLTIQKRDDEHQAFYLDGKEVANTNHDTHGWEGMEAVYDALMKISGQLMWNIEWVWGEGVITKPVIKANRKCENCQHHGFHHLKTGCDRLGCDCKELV